MKTRYFIFISFRGTAYHGWQLQPDSVTVQLVLDNALSVLLGEKINTVGAGRTDAGVHAHTFCAHFESSSAELAETNNLIYRLNRFLPEDISASSVRRVIPDASARYSAISRTYKYYITRAKDPFRHSTSWFLHGKIDINAMNEASSLLLNYDDFTSFSRLHSGARTNICKIYQAVWEEEGHLLIFTIKADRFLRNMVRAITGTVVGIGFGKTGIPEFAEIIEAKDRCKAGTSAPAKGLFLHDIEYPDEIFI